MGVGAMVAVLAVGDGVESLAREQIATTTGFLGVTVQPQTTRSLDGIRVRRTDVVSLGMSDLASLREAAPEARVAVLARSGGVAAQRLRDTTRHGVIVTASAPSIFGVRDVSLRSGALLTAADVDSARAVAVLSDSAARVLAGNSGAAALLGATILLHGQPFTVAGILAPHDGERAELFVPFGTATAVFAGADVSPAAMVLIARRIEDVEPMRRHIVTWLAGRYGTAWSERVRVLSQVQRVEQLTRGMLVYRLLMGSITGIALLVGGIGIMNVLLASVTERTHEIGIRKAVGARDKDILAQFLAESVAITGSGAALGVLLGFGVAFLAAMIMRLEAHAQVHAAVTPGTVLFAVCTSVIVGVSFGLYPALRASRLSPIDAIRHE
jgi:putative ABC transport system permease protein